MKIAFISFEFPPETSGGGIGTYLYNSFQYLTNKGHRVFIFCATKQLESYIEQETVIRIPATDWYDFDTKSLAYFVQYHEKVPFDIVEGTDFRANGLAIKKKYPSIPYVVRLHTPSFLVDQLNFKELNFLSRIRFFLGGIRRFKWITRPAPPNPYLYLQEIENLRMADYILSPSQAIVDKLGDFINVEKVTVIPFFYEAKKEFLQITPKADNQIEKFNIVFIGRHEMRKGVEDILKAMPLVLRENDNVHFYFVGGSASSPDGKTDMIQHLVLKYKRWANYVTFTGRIPSSQMHQYYALGDIFVFPSYWESFGIVCFEAMAAAKAIVASNQGAMAEILADQSDSILISPKSPEGIAKAILFYMAHENERIKFGYQARSKLLSVYARGILGEKTEQFYNEVIMRGQTT